MSLFIVSGGTSPVPSDSVYMTPVPVSVDFFVGPSSICGTIHAESPGDVIGSLARGVRRRNLLSSRNPRQSRSNSGRNFEN